MKTTMKITIALVALTTIIGCNDAAKDTGTAVPPPPPPPAATLPPAPPAPPETPPPAAAGMMSPDAAKASVTAANADQVAADLEKEITADLNAPE